MDQKKMKLFFWDNVLRVYGTGIMVAVAPNVEEARAALLKKEYDIPQDDLNQIPQEFDLSESVAFLCWGSS